ncbi:hypothetical protein K7432_009848 [Basidiobolus ranarum]|uniref:Uncharacterized protein n=1 Tax=Basidiobolus ranarum TaxID=34480 RepID=A0ABR2WPK9_9FUNG
MPASQDSNEVKNQDQDNGHPSEKNETVNNQDENEKGTNGANGAHKSGELGFIKRIFSIPLVHDGVELVSSYVHDTNAGYIKKVASTVENAANSLYKLSEPYQAHFQQPISKVDELGCRSLDYIEAKFPIVKAPTNEVLESLNQNVVTPIQNTAKNIKDRFYGSGSAKSNGNSASATSS